MAIPATRTAVADMLAEVSQLVRNGASSYGRIEYDKLDEQVGDFEMNALGVFESTLNEHGAIAVGANPDTIRLMSVLDEVQQERVRQEELWGIQRYPDGTGSMSHDELANAYKQLNDHGDTSKKWTNILLEEVYEACSADDASALHKELVQVMAVCAAWIQDLDTRPRD